MAKSNAQLERDKIANTLIQEAKKYFIHLIEDVEPRFLQKEKAITGAAKHIVLDMLDQKIQTLLTHKKHFPKNFPTRDAIVKISNEQIRRLRMLKATIMTNF
jgi:thymidylate synthase ThyX